MDPDMSIGLALDNTSIQQEEQVHAPSIQQEEPVSQEGGEVPLSSIRQEEQASLTSIQQEEQVLHTSIQQEEQVKTVRSSGQEANIQPKKQESKAKLWSDQLIGYVGWRRRVEKEGEKEGLVRDTDRRKEGDRKRKTDAKVSFIKQYLVHP
jgi:hypothetical protein